MPSLKEISEMPSIVDKIHESTMRSCHVLGQVLTMIARDDSKETIFEIVDFLQVGSHELKIVDGQLKPSDFKGSSD